MMTLEVAMPVYRPSKRLEAVLTALALQTYRDFYVTIYNDTRPEETEELERDAAIVERMCREQGLRITMHQNPHNLGYMKNMRQIFEKATGDILFLLADDDILTTDCLELAMKAFEDPEIGCVNRPYYWFIDDFRKPVRFEGHLSSDIEKVDFIFSPIDHVFHAMTAAAQLTGLAFRRAFLKGMPYKEDMFTAHVYPYLHVFRDHPVAYMPHCTVAVSIGTSQCQNDIYTPSPIEQWINLYETIMPEPKFAARKKEIYERLLTDFLGFAQIKNYGTYKELLREIFNFAKHRKMNLLSPKYYVFSLGAIFCPRFLLKRLIVWYKKRVLNKRISAYDIDMSKFPFDACAPYWEFSTGNARG